MRKIFHTHSPELTQSTSASFWDGLNSIQTCISCISSDTPTYHTTMIDCESEIPRYNGRVCSKILLDNSSIQRIVYLHTVYVTSKKSNSGHRTITADKKIVHWQTQNSERREVYSSLKYIRLLKYCSQFQNYLPSQDF